MRRLALALLVAGCTPSPTHPASAADTHDLWVAAVVCLNYAMDTPDCHRILNAANQETAIRHGVTDPPEVYQNQMALIDRVAKGLPAVTTENSENHH